MPARATLILNDGETTPVAHTFVPRTGQSNGSLWLPFVRAGTSPVGDEVLSISSRTASRRRLASKLSLPTIVTEVINGVSRATLDHANFDNYEASISPLATTQELKNLRVLRMNWFGSAQAIAMFEGREDYW